MKRSALYIAILIVGFIALPPLAKETAGEENAETCLLSKPHTSANFCQGYEGDDRQFDQCCIATCQGCHTGPEANVDLSGQTPWKIIVPVLSDIYQQDTVADSATLADVCLDCHDERFSERINHPVEIVYNPADEKQELVANPEGPKLICASAESEGGQGCLLRCVSCHKVHPSERAGNQVQGMLRVTNAGSELCLRCHLK